MRLKILAAALAVCLWAGVPMVGQAASQTGGGLLEGLEETVVEVPQARYTYTSSIGAGLKIKGSNAIVTADAVGKKVYTIQIVLRLQKKHGNSWKTLTTWISSGTAPSHSFTATKELKERGTYRVWAKFDVNGEIVTSTSPTKTY